MMQVETAMLRGARQLVNDSNSESIIDSVVDDTDNQEEDVGYNNRFVGNNKPLLQRQDYTTTAEVDSISIDQHQQRQTQEHVIESQGETRVKRVKTYQEREIKNREIRRIQIIAWLEQKEKQQGVDQDQIERLRTQLLSSLQ